jgi:hypothetical protein
MRSVILALAVAAMSATPALALDSRGRALLASDQVQFASNPALASEPGGTVGKSFVPPYSGTIRVSWEVRSQDGTQVSVQLQVNHLSNCSDFTTSTSFVAQTCDIRVAGGMPLNVQAFAGGTNIATLRRVVLHYDVVNANGRSIIWELQAD